ncbi:hypothetical protein ACHAWF_004777 [Thalassiosira exigua]
MAPGGRGSSRRGGNKPNPHKRRRSRGARAGAGASGARVADADGDVGSRNLPLSVGVGANWKNRRRNRRGRGRGKSTTNQNRANDSRPRRNETAAGPSALQPIKVSSSGIMSTWKRPLGGLIRYYVHTRTHHTQSPVDQREAEEEVDRMYYRSGCSMEDTKNKILESLGVTNIQSDWINMSMAIERDVQVDSLSTSNVNTVDGRGIKLQQILRAGEGPAHSNEQWTTVVIPQWAVGKSFFFEVKNNSPLNLSCELYIDGETVARNAPLMALSTRTIRPDTIRYYQKHNWILNSAKREKLASSRNDRHCNHTADAPKAPRYNGLRPDYEGKRVSLEHYPDPTMFGWTFTGGVRESLVEFFEKRMNDGGVVKLDFYYTTGTIKTVLHHPSRGNNQLFRAHVTPQQYVDILKNPRAHTGQGYRTKDNRPNGNCSSTLDEEDDKFDRAPPIDRQEENEVHMEDAGEPTVSEPSYYAKNDTYDFKKQGHQNRREKMSELQQSREYAEWKEANLKEYAVIHAKFFVSIPKRIYGAPRKSARGGSRRRRGNQMEPLPVPEQSVVVDVKAAESATLGTKYEVTGPPQRLGRSNVRMERINGLTDDKGWKGEPVFEKKLYYRAEEIVSGGLRDCSGDEMSEDDDNDDQATLSEYKAEKVDQAKQYYEELSLATHDPEEAEQRLRNTQNKIHLSESRCDVDDVVCLYYTDLIHRQVRN